MPRPLIAVALLSCLLGAPALAEQRALHVTGEGTARAAPDRAQVVLGATVEARSAGQAAAEASKRMAGALVALRALGVDERDLRTLEIDLSPVWRHDDSGAPPKLAGYAARQTLMATLRDLDDLGPAIDAALGAGATDVGGVSFDVEDRAALLDAARRAAVEDAVRTARLMAEAAGVGLGSLTSLTLGRGGDLPRPFAMRAEAAAPPVADTPVAPGEISLSATVEAVWALE